MHESALTGVLPIRVAAADVGSNAIRFVAVEFTNESRQVVLDELRVPVRLGHDAFLKGSLGEPALEAAVRALERFAHRVHDLGIVAYRAVATSAVRESRNGNELIERVRRTTGTVLESVTGTEEARLVHLAVRERVSLGERLWLLADLGGGSLEISIAGDHAVQATDSYPMGSVRMLEQAGTANDAPARLRRKLEQYTAVLRGSRTLRAPLAGCIATGGNIEALARLAGVRPDANGVSVLAVAELKAVTDRLARLSYDERIARLRLNADRADVILPAALVYQRIAELAHFDSIIVPNVGVKDGVVLELRDRCRSVTRF